MSTATSPELRPLYEDAHLLVLDKPPGLLVHPSGLDAHETDTLLARAQAQFGGWLTPAHRLDKGTSGVLLLARDAATASQLGAWFRDGQVRKGYLGLVRGWPAGAQGRIDHPLARDPELPSQGQPQLEAQTDWRCLRRFEWPVQTQPQFAATRAALLALEPLQGRRHQIRRHCKHIAHPLIGDATHGKGPLNRALATYLGLSRLWLHAQWLELPDGRRFEAAPGPEWAAL
ncbi:MAG: pseudouridine synthase [Inhella sp.]